MSPSGPHHQGQGGLEPCHEDHCWQKTWWVLRLSYSLTTDDNNWQGHQRWTVGKVIRDDLLLVFTHAPPPPTTTHHSVVPGSISQPRSGIFKIYKMQKLLLYIYFTTMTKRYINLHNLDIILLQRANLLQQARCFIDLTTTIVCTYKNWLVLCLHLTTQERRHLDDLREIWRLGRITRQSLVAGALGSLPGLDPLPLLALHTHVFIIRRRWHDVMMWGTL